MWPQDINSHFPYGEVGPMSPRLWADLGLLWKTEFARSDSMPCLGLIFKRKGTVPPSLVAPRSW